MRQNASRSSLGDGPTRKRIGSGRTAANFPAHPTGTSEASTTKPRTRDELISVINGVHEALRFLRKRQTHTPTENRGLRIRQLEVQQADLFTQLDALDAMRPAEPWYSR